MPPVSRSVMSAKPALDHSIETPSEPLPEALRALCDALDAMHVLFVAMPKEAFCHALANASSAGAHVRHMIERMESVLRGIESGVVDYDARPRERALEQCPKRCAERVQRVRARYAALTPSHLQQPLKIRETMAADMPVVVVDSTVAREILGVMNHNTHHLAMIKHMQPYPAQPLLPDNFGKAPSTVQHEAHERENKGAKANV